MQKKFSLEPLLNRVPPWKSERGNLGRSLMPTLGLFVFLSGASGLIYQVLWLRRLGLVFGVTIYAASTVIAGFMSGLALGSFFAGRFADRLRRPLLWYGVIEAFVGLSAMTTPAALDALEQFYAALYPDVPHTTAALTFIRFFFCFAILIVPTTLMGATLPIIVKSSLIHNGQLGERVSFLYASNTAGAIAGTLTAGFYLMGSVGMAGSFRIAAAINLLVGMAASLTAFALSGDRTIVEETRAHSHSASGGNEWPDITVSERGRKLTLLVFTVSGFISLALEVIWFRLLILILGVTTYAYTIMLATFLVGIAVGSHWVTRLMRRELNWLALLASIEIVIGVLCPLSLIPLMLLPLGGLIILLIAALIILPATLLMGVAFPIGLRIWATERLNASTREGKRIGTFYSLNVFGSIIGSIAAGFFLLPRLGSQKGLIVLGILSLISGFLLLSTQPQTKRAFFLGVAGTGAILFVIAAFTMPDPFEIVLSHRYPGDTLLWREEGTQLTVSVHQSSEGSRVMYQDGIHQAEDSRTVVDTHRWIAYLPTAILADTQDVLVIGLGAGVTAGAISRYENITVDVVELSETVVRASEWFRHVNYDVLRQPNVHLKIDDGRNYLVLTGKRYDVITADIIRPFQAGSGNLYAAEYFDLARNALKDVGLMLQWIDPSWPEEHYKLVMRTFLRTFPDATIWLGGSLLIGGKKPLQLDRASFARNLNNLVMNNAIEFTTQGTSEPLLSLYTAGPEEMREFAGDGPILTDDRPLIEYFFSLSGDGSPADITLLRGDATRHLKH